MDAIIYARFSPRRNEENCASIDTQVDKCRHYAGTHGYDVLDVYTDEAMSGADGTRPGLKDALAAVKRHTVLLVYKFDRLARDMYLALQIERDVLKAGGTIESATGEGEISKSMSPTEDFTKNIMSAAAALDRKLIGARTSDGMQRRQVNGEVMTRNDRLPYGWSRDPEDPKRMVVNDAERLIAQTIVQLRDEGHKSWRRIASILESQGATFRGRPKWYHTTVRNAYNRFKLTS